MRIFGTKHYKFNPEGLLTAVKYHDYDNTKYVAIVDEKPPRKSMMVKDFIAANPGVKFIELVDIYVYKEFRHQQLGTSIINDIKEDYPGYVILAKVGASEKEYPTMPSDEECDTIAKNLIPFYEKNGFVSVNDKYGNYQCSHVMAYFPK